MLLTSSLLLASAAVVKGLDTLPPWVVTYSPLDGAINVPLDEPLYVNFSEPMDMLSVTADIVPSVPLFPAWALEVSLVLTHTTPFVECTRYDVTVNGRDQAGNPLDGNHDGVGGDPFTWHFTTVCSGLAIIETIPRDGETNVPLDQPIIMTFSAPMNTALVTVSVLPLLTFTSAWSNGNTILTLTHTALFSTCTVYRVTIAAPGLVPGPVPNPWSFTTTGCAPVITSISPPQTNAPIDAAIQVEFSTTMNNATVTWSLNRTLSLTPSWNPDNTTLNLAHSEKFLPCTAYSFSITGKDMFGQTLTNGSVPMPYNFTTVCTYPKLLSTSPAPAQINVALDDPIVVTFSESMYNRSVEDSFSYNDGVTFYTKTDGTSTWNQDNTVFTFSPSSPYRRLITYTVKLNSSIARGLGNNYLDGNKNGNPENSPTDDVVWQFTTVQFVDTVPPHVQSTSPDGGAGDVPRDVSVVVVFSEAMNKLSVQTAISVSDGRTALDPVWDNNSTVRFGLTPPLIFGTQYTITVRSTASDLVGNPMLSDYSWWFVTVNWRGDVTGRVVDDADSAPIANATVVFNGVQTLTDMNGNFTLRNVMAGNYVLNVSKEGYELDSSLHSVGPGLQDLGIIRLHKTPQPLGTEVPLGVILGTVLVVVLVMIVLLFLLSRRRRKIQPTKFEEWKGEVAEVERPGTEQ